jgi:hypothetical protein
MNNKDGPISIGFLNNFNDNDLIYYDFYDFSE